MLSVISFITVAQQNIKDDPISRAEFEVLKYKDPNLGYIPLDIRSKELAFARNLKIKSRSAAPASVWSNRGPFNVGGRTRALAVDINDENIILAGGVSGGLWRTEDQGQTWMKVTTSTDLQSISCIAQDPRAGETGTWYYGTGERSGNSTGVRGGSLNGDGIFKSTDGGQTWNILASTFNDTPQTFDSDFDFNYNIVVNPNNGDVLVANYGGIYRSTDGGTTFDLVLGTNTNGWTTITATSTGMFYAVIASGNLGVFKSSNGVNWTEISSDGLVIGSGDRKSLAIAPSNEDIVYLMGGDGNRSDGVALWKYDDSAGTWTDLSDNIPQYGGLVGDFNLQISYDQMIAVKKDDPDFVVLGGVNLHKSTDGFSTTVNDTWIGGYVVGGNSAAQYFNHHPDQHSFVFLSGNKALSGNDGGVYLTNDITAVPVVWTSLNNGYLTTQAYAISVGPGDQIMAGFQDNSSWLTNSAATDAVWVEQFGGDGAYNAFNLDGTVRWASSQNGNINRMTFTDADDVTANSSSGFEPTSLGYESALFIAPFSLDKETDIFYLGGDSELFINANASTGSSWQTLTNPAGGFISTIGTTGTNMAYVGTTAGKVFKVTNTDDVPELTDITGSEISVGFVSSISVNPYDVDEILVTLSNYSILSIFHSADGGETWTEVGGNLEENPDGTGNGPSVRASQIMGDSFMYYVGTSTGVYSTSSLDGSSTVWTQEDAGLIGNVVVDHMVSRKDGLLAVGTHGNGIYSTEIPFFNADLKPQKILGNIASEGTSSESVMVNILNLGEAAQTDFDVSLYIDNTFIVTDNVQETVSPLSNYEHTFSQAFEFNALDTYDIRVVVSLAGDEDNSNDELNQTVTVLGRPSDISLDNLTVAENEIIGTVVGNLSSTDIDDVDGHTYSLTAGDEATDNSSFSIAGESLVTAEVFNFIAKPTYTITIQTEDKDGNVFAKSFSIDVSDVTGIEELERLGITIFPNPVKNSMSMEMINDYTGNIQIQVLSLSGKEVISSNYQKNQKKTKSLLDLTTLPTGNYIVKINMGGEEITSRLIKE